MPKATKPGTNMTRLFCFRTESSVTARLRLGRTRNAIRCNMTLTHRPEAEILCLYFFHERDGDPTVPAFRCRPFQLDFCHGPHGGRHVVQSAFSLRFPFNSLVGPWTRQDVIGDDALS